MVSPNVVYMEGTGPGKDQFSECRRAAKKLLENCGFVGRRPRFFPSGSRNSAFEDFTNEHLNGRHDFVALLVDSEGSVADAERPWDHLKHRDNWDRPSNAQDEQVFLMTTTMETWIIADRKALRERYGQCLSESALPPLDNLESRPKKDTGEEALIRATSNCGRDRQYKKGKRSFEPLGLVDPATLSAHLPAFARMLRILDEKLPAADKR